MSPTPVARAARAGMREDEETEQMLGLVVLALAVVLRGPTRFDVA